MCLIFRLEEIVLYEGDTLLLQKLLVYADKGSQVELISLSGVYSVIQLSLCDCISVAGI